MTEKISVLLTTEGTYPFSQGGVSTWCDTLVKRLHSVNYTVYSVTMDPFITQKFDTGPNVLLIRVPLWGTEEPSEHLNSLFSATYLAKRRTTDDVILDQFIPLFRQLIRHIISPIKNDHEFANTIVKLYDYFVTYDYKVSFKSELTWRTYKEIILDAVDETDNQFGQPDIYCLIQSLGWIYRFFNIINTPVPNTTVSHASAAAFCALPCIIAKKKYGTPFLLTEHGVYLREQYLSLTKRGYPSFLNSFLIRLIHSITGLCYTFADQISPVCEYNTRWERHLTDRHERIQVIYNGVDHNVFTSVKQEVHERPTVVTVARIDPIKDLLTLIRAAATVKESIPNVRFLIYGSVSVPEYYEECLAERDKLNLGSTVEFVGHVNEMTTAYESADIIAQSSISEAFPYSVIEAMLAGKPVVSTDVGGIPEALGESGILVSPGDVEALAQGISNLLTNQHLRAEMANDAKERALSMFTLDKSLGQYLRTYIKLSLTRSVDVHTPQRKRAYGHKRTPNEHRTALYRQRLLAERGHALIDADRLELAETFFREAIECAPATDAAVVLRAQLAALYERMGDLAKSRASFAQAEDAERYLARRRQQVSVERAYALMDNHASVEQVIKQLNSAIQTNPNSTITSVFMLDLAMLYEQTGQLAKAHELREKVELVMSIRGA